jgi:hypothetical protein
MFPARYELNSYIVFRKRLVSKRLMLLNTTCNSVWMSDTVSKHCPSGFILKLGNIAIL